MAAIKQKIVIRVPYTRRINELSREIMEQVEQRRLRSPQDWSFGLDTLSDYYGDDNHILIGSIPSWKGDRIEAKTSLPIELQIIEKGGKYMSEDTTIHLPLKDLKPSANSDKPWIDGLIHATD